MKKTALLLAALLLCVGVIHADTFFDPLTGRVMTLPPNPSFESVVISGTLLRGTTSDVIALFDSGLCSGYLKSDGTCDTPAGGDVTAVGDCASGDCTMDAAMDSVDISPTSGTWDLSSLTSLVLPGLKNGTTSAGFVRFYEDGDNGDGDPAGAPDEYGDLIAPAAMGSNLVWTLPSSTGTLATTAEVIARSGKPHEWEASLDPDNQFANYGAIIPLTGKTAAAFTVSEIYVQLNEDPTNELTITCYQKATAVNFADGTVIGSGDTANGILTINSGWTDETVPSGSKIWCEIGDNPDATTLHMTLIVRGSYD